MILSIFQHQKFTPTLLLVLFEVHNQSAFSALNYRRNSIPTTFPIAFHSNQSRTVAVILSGIKILFHSLCTLRIPCL